MNYEALEQCLALDSQYQGSLWQADLVGDHHGWSSEALRAHNYTKEGSFMQWVLMCGSWEGFPLKKALSVWSAWLGRGNSRPEVGTQGVLHPTHQGLAPGSHWEAGSGLEYSQWL